MVEAKSIPIHLSEEAGVPSICAMVVYDPMACCVTTDAIGDPTDLDFWKWRNASSKIDVP
jgi:hypothetical protein